ncbi:hypothetical protein HAX54_014371, partial [Datura stramonium]|nr:hypothetical protein [Datura stramonium]
MSTKEGFWSSFEAHYDRAKGTKLRVFCGRKEMVAIAMGAVRVGLHDCGKALRSRRRTYTWTKLNSISNLIVLILIWGARDLLVSLEVFFMILLE